MRNIEKIKQKKLNELIDGFINQLPNLKLDLQKMGENDEYKNGKKQLKLFDFYAKKSKDGEILEIGNIIKKRLKKEVNIDYDTI